MINNFFFPIFVQVYFYLYNQICSSLNASMTLILFISENTLFISWFCKFGPKFKTIFTIKFKNVFWAQVRIVLNHIWIV